MPGEFPDTHKERPGGAHPAKRTRARREKSRQQLRFELNMFMYAEVRKDHPRLPRKDRRRLARALAKKLFLDIRSNPLRAHDASNLRKTAPTAIQG